MKYIIICCFILINFTCAAQVGLTAYYDFMQAPAFQERVQSNESFLGGGFAVGVNYWFRLKKKRLEFTPEANYARFKNDFNSLSHDFQYLSFIANANIYFLDFGNDCDCPTFSKQNDVLKRGIFIQIAPTISYLQQQWQASDQTSKQKNVLAYGLGVGLGFDIGISDFLTITPLVRATRYFDVDLLETATGEGYHYPVNRFSLGLRFGFRWKK